jgi:hypothetical protein
MTNTPPSFRSTVHDENGFRFVRDNGTNPQTIGTAANSYLFESGGLKEDGLRLGWVYGGALRSLTDVNAPEADGDHILVSESENGTQLVDITYDEPSDKADMDLSGALTVGSVTAGAVSSSGNVTAAGKLIGANLDAGSDTATTAASGSTTTKTVSFNKTFAAAPKVVVGFTYDNSATGTTNSFGNCAISAVNITTTGFTAKFYNGSGTQKTPTFDWIALLP